MHSFVALLVLYTFFFAYKRNEETNYLMEVKDQIQLTNLIGKVGEKEIMSTIYERF